MVIPHYKKATRDRLLADLSRAKGINGLRALIKQYLSRTFRIALVAQSPEFFLLYYLGFKLPEHQVNWIKLWRHKVRYVIDLSPRDHGKSWMFSYGLPLWDIYSSYARTNLQSVDASILQISKTSELAGKFARQVQETIEKNVRLREDFGDIADHNYWFKQTFRCKRLVTETVEKDFTYENVGLLGAITGGHFRRIVLDDILDDENTKTIERMTAIENWFWGTIWNMKEIYTRFMMVGTRKNRRDIYSRVLANSLWHANVEKAIIKYPMLSDGRQGWLYVTSMGRKLIGPQELKPEEKIVDVDLLTDDYQVLWPPTIWEDGNGNPEIDPETYKPKLFGWGIKELLMDRAAQGSVFFSREKQNEISDESGAIFRKEWLTYFDGADLTFNETDGFFYLTTDLEKAAGVA